MNPKKNILSSVTMSASRRSSETRHDALRFNVQPHRNEISGLMKRGTITLFLSRVLCVLLPLAPLDASAEQSKPYPRKPFPEELEAYRVILETQQKEVRGARRFRVCDITIEKDKDRVPRYKGDPTPSARRSTLAHSDSATSRLAIPGPPSALIEKLVSVNRRTLPRASKTPSDLFDEAGELRWMYISCSDLFPEFVSRMRMPNVYRGIPEFTFSRVAFDQNGTTALVYLWINGLYGEEQFVTMLAKDQSGTWKIVTTQEWVGR